MDIGTVVAGLLVLLVGLTLGAVVGALWVRARAAAEVTGSLVRSERLALEARAADSALVRDGLKRLHEQVRDLESHRVAWQSQLKQQVEDVRHSTDSLRRETAGLSTALRKPQVRGRWGELHLRRAVEVAGLVARCDFAEQVTVRGEDRAAATGQPVALRPDLVVHLAGGKHVVVDAKVPLDAFLDATCADTDSERDAMLARHARQLRQHVDALSAKGYWRALNATPEFVVLFMPGESFLSAALEAEPSLLEYAAARRVVLATPTTLIALLRTVAYAWTSEALADRARDILVLGRELYGRIGGMGRHLDRLGRSLANAVDGYNKAVGSLESRVLVSARRFAEFEVADDELACPRPVSEAPRPLTAGELVDTVGDRDHPGGDRRDVVVDRTDHLGALEPVERVTTGKEARGA